MLFNINTAPPNGYYVLRKLLLSPNPPTYLCARIQPAYLIIWKLILHVDLHFTENLPASLIYLQIHTNDLCSYTSCYLTSNSIFVKFSLMSSIPGQLSIFYEAKNVRRSEVKPLIPCHSQKTLNACWMPS